MRLIDLIGKTIDRIVTDGYMVFIVFTDGAILEWEIYESEEGLFHEAD